MNSFSFTNYLDDTPANDQPAIKHIIELISQVVPEATEGTSYGFPAFKYHERPLIGFGYKDGLWSLYPFDPRIIASLRQELDGFEVGKGYVRFTSDQPLPDKTILLMLDLRLDHLQSQIKT